MERQQKIAQEVEKTLDLLEHAERLTPDPFFFTRLQAQIKEKQKKQAWRELTAILKPVFLVVLLTVNIITAVYLMGTARYRATSSAHSELKSEFAKEFGFQVTGSEFFITQ